MSYPEKFGVTHDCLPDPNRPLEPALGMLGGVKDQVMPVVPIIGRVHRLGLIGGLEVVVTVHMAAIGCIPVHVP